jgi:hemolysin III
VVAFEPLVRAVEVGGVVLLLLGGIAYTAGLIFYAWKRLPYNHAVWHVFVLAGSVCHFACVLGYVIPPAP